MPPEAVYRVKFCSRARTAARLMLSGVGKSGSPALKSITSTPEARSRAASAATFMVDDSLMVEIRSAIALSTAGILSPSCGLAFRLLSNTGLRQTVPQPRFHGRRHEPGDVPAQAEN